MRLSMYGTVVVRKHECARCRITTKYYRGNLRQVRATRPARNGSRDVIDHITIRFHICHASSASQIYRVGQNTVPFYAYMPRQFRLSACPSVTRVICIQTAKRIIELLSRSDRPIILVFICKGHCVNLTASPPTGAPNTSGRVAIFDQYISKTLIDSGIVTMEDEYKVV